MKITLTFKNDKQCKDYQLDDAISIDQALKLIQESDYFFVPRNIRYIYSQRKEEKISTLYTFKQAKIYSGDVINIIE